MLPYSAKVAWKSPAVIGVAVGGAEMEETMQEERQNPSSEKKRPEKWVENVKFVLRRPTRDEGKSALKRTKRIMRPSSH